VTIHNEICHELSDNEIVTHSLVDMDYFICLYERYELRLLRYIQRITMVSEEQARDILQEAFIKIWQNLNGFNQKMKLSSWIYRIVHNETISYWRNKKSFGKDRKVKLEDHIATDTFDDMESSEDDGRNDFLTHEVLALLPIHYKTILILKFIEDMSYQEISDVLKIPEGTVATRINRAKKRFVKMASDHHISFFEQN
jgi:RNA polymerase sigma-70 factor, ECF subfamily